jgi:hypothetical protein
VTRDQRETARFDRRALWLPLLIPVLAGVIVFPASTLHGRLPVIVQVIVGLAYFLFFTGVVYFLPYALMLLFVYSRITSWSAQRRRRAFWTVPVLISLAGPGYIAAIQLDSGVHRWRDGCLEAWLIALPMSFGYAQLVRIVGHRRRDTD